MAKSNRKGGFTTPSAPAVPKPAVFDEPPAPPRSRFEHVADVPSSDFHETPRAMKYDVGAKCMCAACCQNRDHFPGAVMGPPKEHEPGEWVGFYAAFDYYSAPAAQSEDRADRLVAMMNDAIDGE